MRKCKKSRGGGVRSGWRSGRGFGQGGCVQRIEVIVKMQKKSGWSCRGGGGGRGQGGRLQRGPVWGAGSGWMCKMNKSELL